MDEPTNDLDAETLEMLEERLVEYSGTLLVVSHDREFLNNVVTSTIAMVVNDDGSRSVEEYVGGYDDWLRQLAPQQPKLGNTLKATELTIQPSVTTTSQSLPQSAPTKAAEKTSTKRLSFKEQKELEALPGRIGVLEAAIDKQHAVLADPNFYKGSGPQIAVNKPSCKNWKTTWLPATYDWKSSNKHQTTYLASGLLI